MERQAGRRPDPLALALLIGFGICAALVAWCALPYLLPPVANHRVVAENGRRIAAESRRVAGLRVSGSAGQVVSLATTCSEVSGLVTGGAEAGLEWKPQPGRGATAFDDLSAGMFRLGYVVGVKPGDWRLDGETAWNSAQHRMWFRRQAGSRVFNVVVTQGLPNAQPLGADAPVIMVIHVVPEGCGDPSEYGAQTAGDRIGQAISRVGGPLGRRGR